MPGLPKVPRRFSTLARGAPAPVRRRKGGRSSAPCRADRARPRCPLGGHRVRRGRRRDRPRNPPRERTVRRAPGRFGAPAASLAQADGRRAHGLAPHPLSRPSAKFSQAATPRPRRSTCPTSCRHRTTLSRRKKGECTGPNPAGRARSAAIQGHLSHGCSGAPRLRTLLKDTAPGRGGVDGRATDGHDFLPRCRTRNGGAGTWILQQLIARSAGGCTWFRAVFQSNLPDGLHRPDGSSPAARPGCRPRGALTAARSCRTW